MKKLFLVLLAALGITAGASAMTPKEAFDALSKLPNLTIHQPDYNLPVIAEVVQNGQISAGYNMNAQQILVTATAAYKILNQLPMTDMIIGANNKEVAAFVYGSPNAEGSNDVLIVAMSGYRGSAVFMYGTMNNADVRVLRSAPLNMEGNYLNLESTMPDGSEFNIIMSKAR